MFVVTITGVVLLILCVKIFCCKKSPYQPADSEDATGGDRSKRTEIRPRLPADEAEPQQRGRSVEFVKLERHQPRDHEEDDEVL